MSIDIENVEFSFDFLATGADEIYQNVKTILSTPMGTVPFDRDFGIDWDILDKPIKIAKAQLTIEYIEKVKKYEPRANITQVSFTSDSNGTLKPKVVIDIVT